jgi:hypothetical protein
VPRRKIPAGFDASGYPNRRRAAAVEADPEFPITAGGCRGQVVAGLQEYFGSRGWVLDHHGRPLHPRHAQLLADEWIGLPTVLGFAWWFGETAVVDAVVTAAGAVLLTRDTDRGRKPCPTGATGDPDAVGIDPQRFCSLAGRETTVTRNLRISCCRQVLRLDTQAPTK